MPKSKSPSYITHGDKTYALNRKARHQGKMDVLVVPQIGKWDMDYALKSRYLLKGKKSKSQLKREAYDKKHGRN